MSRVCWGFSRDNPWAAGGLQGTQKWMVKAETAHIASSSCVYFCPMQWFPVSFNHLASLKSLLKRMALHRLEDIGGELKEELCCDGFSLQFFSLARENPGEKVKGCPCAMYMLCVWYAGHPPASLPQDCVMCPYGAAGCT